MYYLARFERTHHAPDRVEAVLAGQVLGFMYKNVHVGINELTPFALL